MKKFFLLLLALISLSCKPQQVSISAIEWKLVKLENTDVSSLNPPVTLLLDEQQKKISGFAGCNRFFGSYQTENSSITFSGMGSTKMFCQDTMKVEDDYFKALGTVQSYRREGDKLFLLAGDRVVMEFKK
ncbi:MAG TPA: META domain-containing protein [Cyclobacteriaceae bacterium]